MECILLCRANLDCSVWTSMGFETWGKPNPNKPGVEFGHAFELITRFREGEMEDCFFSGNWNVFIVHDGSEKCE